jgi:chromate transporter
LLDPRVSLMMEAPAARSSTIPNGRKKVGHPVRTKSLPPEGSSISLRRIFFVFFRVGLLSFGGGFAMLPILRHELHDRRHWMSDEDLTDIVSVATVFPGAVSVNAAFLQGLRMRGGWGVAVAVAGIVTPSILVILLVAAFLSQFSTAEVVLAFFKGAGAAVTGLIAYAAFVYGKGARLGWPAIVLTAVILVSLLLFRIHPVIAVVASGVLGQSIVTRRRAP